MEKRVQLAMSTLALCAALALAACSGAGGGSPDPANPADLPNQITDVTTARTLDAATVYNVYGTVTVSAKLTIPPGTVIRFAPYSNYGSQLVVDTSGQIDAQGTPAKPISFTSTNATPAAGDWGGINVDGNYSVFSYCTFAYAGNGVRAALVITGSNTNVSNCAFTNNVVALDARDAGAATVMSSNAIYANSSGSTSLWPVYINKNVDLDNLNTFTRPDLTGANVPQGIVCAGDITSDWELKSTAAPYIFDGVYTVSARLTADPGVTLKFTTYSNYGSGLAVSGQLIANGSALLPITFTSVKDGGSVSPAMSDWGGLDISGAGCSFTYCTFKYSGNGNNDVDPGRAALDLYVDAVVTDCVFGYNWTCIDTTGYGGVPIGGTASDDFTTIGSNQYNVN